jgi:hypothetical protein
MDKKRTNEDFDDDRSTWRCGSGSIEEVDIVDVCSDGSHHKTKKQKLDNYSSSPIKTTPTSTVESSTHQYKQSSDSPLLKSNGVTAVYAKMETTSGLPKKSSSKSKYKKTQTSSKKVNKPKLIRVLLDSGSDGDLMFHKKGTPKCFPYSARLVPKSWCTSNGTFHTEEKGKLEIQFCWVETYELIADVRQIMAGEPKLKRI